MSRSPFSRAMEAFEAADADHQRQVVTRYMLGLLNGEHRVRFRTLAAFHHFTTMEFPFVRMANEPEPTRKGSRQIFYLYRHLQVRVKTDGTAFRPRPHLVVTLAVGQGWDDEIGKFNSQGRLIPKLGFVGAPNPPNPANRRLAANNDWRNLSRLGDSLQEIREREDVWANACHFDFVDGFDASGAESI